MPFDRRKIMIRDFWTCQTCGERVDQHLVQIAHKIRQDKTQKGTGSVRPVADWLKTNKGVDMSATEIVAKIINHHFNVCVTCCQNCNDAQNIFFNPVEFDKLMEKIYSDITK